MGTAAAAARTRTGTTGETGWVFDEAQVLERWQHRAQRAQRRQIGHREALVDPADFPRLAQRLAARPHLEAQRCCSLQLLLQRRRQQLSELAAGAAEVDGEAWLERVE